MNYENFKERFVGGLKDKLCGTEFHKSEDDRTLDDIYEDEMTCGTEYHMSEPENKKARDTVGMEAGISGRQVQKYIALTELIPPLLDIVNMFMIKLLAKIILLSMFLMVCFIRIWVGVLSKIGCVILGLFYLIMLVIIIMYTCQHMWGCVLIAMGMSFGVFW